MQTTNIAKNQPLRHTSMTDNQVIQNKAPRTLIMGGVLTMAVFMTGCSPTESKQSETQNGAQKSAAPSQDIDLLNVSYDVSRDFYKDYNTLFAKGYQKEHPNSKVHINQSHGGSSKQALSVANGLQADVVTFNQESNMKLCVENG